MQVASDGYAKRLAISAGFDTEVAEDLDRCVALFEGHGLGFRISRDVACTRTEMFLLAACAAYGLRSAQEEEREPVQVPSGALRIVQALARQAGVEQSLATGGTQELLRAKLATTDRIGMNALLQMAFQDITTLLGSGGALYASLAPPSENPQLQALANEKVLPPLQEGGLSYGASVCLLHYARCLHRVHSAAAVLLYHEAFRAHSPSPTYLHHLGRMAKYFGAQTWHAAADAMCNTECAAYLALHTR